MGKTEGIKGFKKRCIVGLAATGRWVLPSYGNQRHGPGSILQDKAIVRVIDRLAPGRILPNTLDFLPPHSFPAYRGAGPEQRSGQQAPFSTRPYGQRYLSQLCEGLCSDHMQMKRAAESVLPIPDAEQPQDKSGQCTVKIHCN